MEKKDKRGGPRKNAGGRRVGSGRKPDYLRKLGLPPLAARVLLARVNEEKLVDDLLKNGSMDVRLRTWQTLREWVYGKPRQALELGGGFGIASFDGHQLTTEQIDERIKQLQRELGIVEPARNVIPQLALPAVEKAAPKPLPKPIPSNPMVTLEPSNLPRVNVPGQSHCDKHGPFVPQSRWEPNCPECKFEWEQQNQADQDKLSRLMPGEPFWTRNR